MCKNYVRQANIYCNNHRQSELSPFLTYQNSKASLLSTDELLDLRENLDVRSTGIRLHAVHVVTPPRSSSPVQPTSPDVRIVVQVLEFTLESLNALGVRSSGSLTDDTSLLVILEPLGSLLDTLDTNGAADTVGVGTRVV